MSAPSRVPAQKRQRGACGVDKKIEMCYNSKTVVSEVYLIGSKIDRTVLQRQLTDPDLKSRDRVVKKTEKDGLYNAMDVAAVWLDRALANN